MFYNSDAQYIFSCRCKKDLVIKNIIEKDKHQSTNMAKQDAKARSQPQGIGRHEATAFTNTNITLLTPDKHNQKQGSCKKNFKNYS